MVLVCYAEVGFFRELISSLGTSEYGSFGEGSAELFLNENMACSPSVGSVMVIPLKIWLSEFIINDKNLATMQRRRTFQNDDQTSLSDLLPTQNTKYPIIPDAVRLTFVDDRQGIRGLSAENAAKHRHSIFTGAYSRVLQITGEFSFGSKMRSARI